MQYITIKYDEAFHKYFFFFLEVEKKTVCFKCIEESAFVIFIFIYFYKLSGYSMYI